ncbi:porin [Vibrio porteresiae]|uniref:Porin n=1 Tax=Vibrio porteresiae DSM 19223 TaxID=1123496 RepID=A0ABZ0QI66_9VIBR|nr:porin [Vibrio porteresiae]WPC76193.1 porin [Vibrio porteresiae DSM 19223]
MNKAITIIAMVPIMFLSDLANSAEMYNRNNTKVELYAGINARREFNNSGNYDKTLVDLGFYGETKVTKDIIGYGFWQSRMTEGSNEWSSNYGVRQQYAGIKMENIGSIDYGRNFGILYDVERYTDVAPYFSGETWSANADNFMVTRGSSMLTYRNKDLFGQLKGLDFALQYQAKKEGYGVDKDNGEGYGSSISYQITNDLKITGAYSRSRRTPDQNLAEWQDPKYAKAWGIGSVYTTNHLYLAAVYAETKNMTQLIMDDSTGTDYLATADKAKNLELVAQYQFDNGLRPSISYVKTKVEDGLAGDYTFAEYVQAGVLYKLNANIQLWFDHRYSMINKPVDYFNSISDDRTAAGVIFMF